MSTPDLTAEFLSNLRITDRRRTNRHMTKCWRPGVFFPIVFVLLALFIAGADDHIPAIAWRIPIGQPPGNPGGRKPELAGSGGFGAAP